MALDQEFKKHALALVLAETEVDQNCEVESIISLANTSGKEYLAEMASYPGLLEIVMSLFSFALSEISQRNALNLFVLLAINDENKITMASVPGTIESLLSLLHQSRPQCIQCHALKCFILLAVADENKVPIASISGVMSTLTDLLQVTCPADIQYLGILAIGVLSMSSDNSERFLYLPGLVFGLEYTKKNGKRSQIRQLAVAAADFIFYMHRGEVDQSSVLCVQHALEKLRRSTY
ncbi:hypothetical protein MPTK1_5g12990 [Marchantia polymorpha subsp. ruderalis]|uniref:Uncharacterized protein n=2 Tax=Marchantia polymorpha TaxID=3197 RepID=A0AAF6BHT2_MARPO|nr:hypothetical protein MARPO_0092s0009 [Marchantia polymorpha]BBN11566.1 hypothetical protein Mp_5g12990 [Marchantia polymorpha subsp. ruderalis]|eukprot:PTQ33035.1 hypothetical protein MARPO_0092s0009 [Marchantia polymorpha]